MDYFKVNKYSSVEENILYISSNIIELYEKRFCPEISVNIETCIYLSMLFLYGIGKVEMNDKKIKLVVK